MKKHFTRVTIVIPHYNGEALLRRCLLALRKTTYSAYRTIVVDNGSQDKSRCMVRSEFPEVILIESPVNLGFAAGCNLGIRSTDSPYVVLLNNDTEVDPGWLDPLVELMESDPSIGAAQPKMLSIQNPNRFDYCGAGGGEIDVFGYPFAWGRVFGSIEEDKGQYNTRRSVFWASGAATILRRSALDHVGLLDEAFFAHMEEIDLNWRLHLAGYSVMYEPCSTVYHRTASTLTTERIRKMILNHRNNILILLKNFSFDTLLWVLPLRLILEGITIIGSIFIGQKKRALAVPLGLIGILPLLRTIMKRRHDVKTVRSVSEKDILRKMYRGSVALNYYMKKLEKATEFYSKRGS